MPQDALLHSKYGVLRWGLARPCTIIHDTNETLGSCMALYQYMYFVLKQGSTR
jgi:hypothetical protein